MIKSELIEELAKRAKVSKTLAEDVLNAMLEEMAEALARGERIELRGFGVFSVREYEAYTGRNPKTGEQLEVTPKRLPHWTTGKDLERKLGGTD